MSAGSLEALDSCPALSSVMTPGEKETISVLPENQSFFFEKVSQEIVREAFQQLLDQDVWLMEVACSPNSRLREAVQKLSGREDSAVRCAHWNWLDLESGKGVKALIQLLHHKRPRHVWISPECGPYSPIQAINQRTPQQVAELEQKRRSALKQYIGASCVYATCIQLGIHVTWEWSEKCQGWRLPFMQKLQKKYQPYVVTVHGCRVGLRDPKSSGLLKKGWKIMTSLKKLAEAMDMRCKCPPNYNQRTRLLGSCSLN